MHSLMLLGVNDISHFDWSAFRFFPIQVFGIAAEDVFRRLTGQSVGGPVGWLLTIGFLFIAGSRIGEFATQLLFALR